MVCCAVHGDAEVRISVVIPTYNAEAYMDSLLSVLEKQSMPIDEIIVIDSASSDNTIGIAKKYKNVKIMEIKRPEFNHGTTRHKAFLESKGDIVCFLTQDALPKNETYIENLTKPFNENPKIACVYGRQIAKENANVTEKLSKEFNYSNKSFIRSKADIETFGIKAFFTTNVCSAYRRSSYLQVGGFKDVIVSEDMEISYRFLIENFNVFYEANAVVFHSHDYTFSTQFKRHFDISVFLKNHPQCDLGTIGEGMKSTTFALKKLLIQVKFLTIIYFLVECVIKLTGNIIGKYYRIFPNTVARKMSGQKNWWETE